MWSYYTNQRALFSGTSPIWTYLGNFKSIHKPSTLLIYTSPQQRCLDTINKLQTSLAKLNAQATTAGKTEKQFFEKPVADQTHDQRYRNLLLEWVIKSNLSFVICRSARDQSSLLLPLPCHKTNISNDSYARLEETILLLLSVFLVWPVTWFLRSVHEYQVRTCATCFV